MSIRRTLEWLAKALGAATLSAAVAWWGWQWFAPPSIVVPPNRAHEPVPSVALALSPPFGTSRETAATSASAPIPTGELRLLGVIAERDGGGQALFRFADGSARLVAAGAPLPGSATLVAVKPDGVIVRDAGGERSISLRPPAARASAAKPGAGGQGASCAIPRGFRGAVVRLNAELLPGLIGDPQSLRAVVDAEDGALVVRDETGFATMLGLRRGDRVTQANGIALRAPEDLVVSILRPLAANQAVRVQGMRGTEPRELLILNAGACPG